MNFIRKILKNKLLVLSCCVIVVSLIYTAVQKAIENYNLKSSKDIVITDDIASISEEDSYKGEINYFEDEVQEEIQEEVAEEVNLKNGEQTEFESKIYVYITGEVNNPGVVILTEGSRIVDAINSAGGTTANADISKINLVYVLEDGMKVNIPNKNDLKKESEFEYITMNSGDRGNDDYSTGKASSKDYSSSSDKTNTSTGISTNSKKYDLVNINTATQTELETLPGIGPSLALKIINYRKENGMFSSIEQIKEVSGIGESKFESLKSYITI